MSRLCDCNRNFADDSAIIQGPAGKARAAVGERAGYDRRMKGNPTALREQAAAVMYA